MRDSAKAKLKNTNDSDDELDSARVFRVETLKMRKLQEQREEQRMIAQLKRHKSRIQTQSANNFYKPSRNKIDIYRPMKTGMNWRPLIQHAREEETDEVAIE